MTIITEVVGRMKALDELGWACLIGVGGERPKSDKSKSFEKRTEDLKAFHASKHLCYS